MQGARACGCAGTRWTHVYNMTAGRKRVHRSTARRRTTRLHSRLPPWLRGQSMRAPKPLPCKHSAQRGASHVRKEPRPLACKQRAPPRASDKAADCLGRRTPPAATATTSETSLKYGTPKTASGSRTDLQQPRACVRLAVNGLLRRGRADLLGWQARDTITTITLRSRHHSAFCKRVARWKTSWTALNKAPRWRQHAPRRARVGQSAGARQGVLATAGRQVWHRGNRNKRTKSRRSESGRWGGEPGARRSTVLP